MINTAIKNQIIDHAAQAYPKECCGLLVDSGGTPTYWPCRNLSNNKDHFIMDPEDYAVAEAAGEIIAVVHSHPDVSPRPSEADKVSCEASGLPWHIVSYPGLDWSYTEPTGYKAPLIGRPFFHGVLDCYALIRDWYAQERGVALPEAVRADGWWHKGENLYVDNFERAGFRRVFDEPQVGDIMLMQILANVPNHGAIYLGNDIILHHLHNRLSCREVWKGYYRDHTVIQIRYGNA